MGSQLWLELENWFPDTPLSPTVCLYLCAIKEGIFIILIISLIR